MREKLLVIISAAALFMVAVPLVNDAAGQEVRAELRGDIHTSDPANTVSAGAFAAPLFVGHGLFAGRIPTALRPDENSPISPALGEKSKGKALLLSFLLPGLGQRYAGAAAKSKLFLGSEITFWLGYAGFQTYSDWRREEYASYAARYAGIDPDGKSDTYYTNIGNYDSIDEYNAAKLRQRNLSEYYRDVDKWHWQWDSAAHKAHFDQLRISAERARNRSTFVLGAILANHLVSAIDAVWSVNRYNASHARRVEWNLQFGDGLIQPHFLCSLQAHL